MNIHDTQIDYYNTRFDLEKVGSRPLKEVFDRIKTQNKGKVKDKQPGNVFASFTYVGRQHKDIKAYTGFMFMDIDECTDAQQVKDIFINCSNTVATWFSFSGNVHAIIKIPICLSLEEYKRRYQVFRDVLKEQIGDLGIFDNATSNPSLIAFESHDPKIYISTKVRSFNAIYPPPPAPPKPKPLNTKDANHNTKRILEKIRQNVPNIQAPGYNQLLALSYVIGGHVGYGYIPSNVALEELKTSIRANAYFNSKESSGTLKTYLKGGQSAFLKGIEKPLALTD